MAARYSSRLEKASQVQDLERDIHECELELAETTTERDRQSLEAVLRRLRWRIERLESEQQQIDVAPRSGAEPVLPDSSYVEPLPSVRARFSASWNEGAPRGRGTVRPRRRHAP